MTVHPQRGNNSCRVAQLDNYIVAAIRLAFAAGADDRAKVAVVDRLLSYAPMSDPGATQPVRLLLRAIRDADAELVVR